jgi:hypothetical protein
MAADVIGKGNPTLEVEKCLREVARTLRNAEYETRTNKTSQTAKIMQTLCSLRIEISGLETVLRSISQYSQYCANA